LQKLDKAILATQASKPGEIAVTNFEATLQLIEAKMSGLETAKARIMTLQKEYAVLMQEIGQVLV